MEAPAKPNYVVIDGKPVAISYLPAAPFDRDLEFDRFAHDNSHISPDVTRSEALAMKGNWQSGDKIQVMGKNGRVRPKRQY